MLKSLKNIHSNTILHSKADGFGCMRFLLMLGLIFGTTFSYSQVIKGSILDQSTGKVIPYASIYFSGTTFGTTSNENGYFELNHPLDISIPLTISFVGYDSETLVNFLSGEKLSVKLKPTSYDLPDIEVSGDKSRNIRKKYLPVFRNEFLGKKINPKLCRILNEGDIMLQYDPSLKILKATARRPIQIKNEYLGYDIIYFLDRFEFSLTNKSLIYTGSYLFTPVMAVDTKQQSEFDANRINAYLGSRMHLFRSLWEDSFELSGFSAVSIKGEPIPPDKLNIGKITDVNGVPQKAFYMLGPFAVYYKVPTTMTKIVLKNGILPFDSNGYFDPMEIVWEGYMANKRISDLLPFEYIPDASSLKKSKEL